MSRFDVADVQRGLAEANGGYEVVHRSSGLEIFVYVLVAPERTVSRHTRTTRCTSCSRDAAC